MSLDEQAAAAMRYQNYPAPPEIQGVQHLPLTKYRALEGAFMEYLRLDGGQVEGLAARFEARQISVSWASPGRINAFHIHPKRPQDEVWCVLEGSLLVWLADLRADSPTRGNRRSFLLSGEAPALLFIPSGVAHGYRAGHKGALLLYAMNDQFNPADPNEGRLPWDFFGADLWAEDRG
ncbi:MAG: dTDP-4-dehydrorhamnose 3,5-epimerase family protein [Meiothermus sp.]|uniref:dTDP-4-dehydrorhamnose 3,5-epimerase family protein n=2 Tax=Meiothermus sp. TaxID=1955249 RepID=UPI0025CE6311|nr:dTDP-4-dehydrorhamnose 3,5-epimerase family protein [Meiothermus sp.]MCS7069791.1 dTDP-4-dehydrorhamnose 3,5-epimerase family protein [Meiothermus sp.]